MAYRISARFEKGGLFCLRNCRCNDTNFAWLRKKPVKTKCKKRTFDKTGAMILPAPIRSRTQCNFERRENRQNSDVRFVS